MTKTGENPPTLSPGAVYGFSLRPFSPPFSSALRLLP